MYNIQFNSHVNNIFSKALTIFNIIFRYPVIMLTLYMIIKYVIPILEHNSFIWNPDSDLFV